METRVTAAATGSPIKAPLTPMQAGIWLMNQAYPGRPVFNSSVVIRIKGELDPAALLCAVAGIVQRHAPLRSQFQFEAGVLTQSERAEAALDMETLDLSGHDHMSRVALARQAVIDFTGRPIDLRTDLPLAVCLVKLSADHYIFAARIHHVAFDGWSAEIFRRELLEFYSAQCERREPSVEPLKTTFDEYAARQNAASRDGSLEPSIDYWARSLTGVPDSCVFPPDHALPETPSFRSARHRMTLSASTLAAITTLGRQERATPFMVMLAVFQSMLARLTGQEDIVVGVPVAGRDSADVEPLIGCFINNIVLRSDITPSATFRELIRKARGAVLEGMAHQQAPYQELVRRLKPLREVGSGRLFDVMFQLINVPSETSTSTSGVRFERFDLDDVPSESPVTFTCVIRNGALECSCAVELDSFDRPTASLLLDQFAALLTQALDSPDAPMAVHSLGTTASRLLLPDPAAQLPEPPFVPPVLAVLQRAETCPGATAVSAHGKVWAYAELAADVHRAAATLTARGLIPGESIGIVGTKSYGLLVSALAVMRAGGVVVLLDIDLPQLRIVAMLSAARAEKLVAVGGEARVPPGLPQPLLQMDDVGNYPDNSIADHASTLPNISGDDAAYVFFTSGTTGVPKAVLGTHKGIAHYIAWEAETVSVTRADRVSMLTALTFDPILRDIFLPLQYGATLCIPPHGMSGRDVVTWLGSERVSIVHTVPSLSDTWLEVRPAQAQLGSVRAVLFTGEPLTEGLINKWRSSLQPETKFINVYGPTETTMEKSFFIVPSPARPGVQPIGQPFPQTQLLIMNYAGTLCGVNEPGEILIRTPFSTRGYLNNPEEQSSRFVANPFKTHQGETVYRTGDLGRYLQDGNIAILGRTDDQVKISGVRVEPGEINSVLLSNPAVKNSAVVARKTGQSARLVAYVVLNSPADEPELRRYLAARVPHVMVPADIVIMESLPVGQNGKLDRRALPEPMPPSIVPAAYSEPLTVLERRLARIWCDVLRRERVGRGDNFFDLGGHSLVAAQIFDRIYRVFNRHLPLNTLFSAPTLSQLATVIQKTDGTWPSLVPVRSSGVQPPLFFVHGAGGSTVQFQNLARHLSESQPIYAFEAVGLDGIQKPRISIEHMASAYVEDVIRVDERGPYFLAGASMGGLVAYEIARQLAQMDKRVAMLGLGDTYLPAPHVPSPSATFKGAANKAKRTLRAARDSFHHWRDGRLPPELARGNVLRANIHAMRSYRPLPLTVPTVMFRTRATERHAMGESQIEAWRRLVGPDFRIVEVEGVHAGEGSYLSEPYVSKFADQLAGRLDAARLAFAVGI